MCIKKYFISFIISFLLLVFLLFFVNIFVYNDILSDKILNVMFIVFTIISIGLGAYFLGYNSSKNGYIEGGKYGFLWILVFAICCIIFRVKLTFTSFIYYLSIFIFSMISSILGINKKTSKN